MVQTFRRIWGAESQRMVFWLTLGNFATKELDLLHKLFHNMLEMRAVPFGNHYARLLQQWHCPHCEQILYHLSHRGRDFISFQFSHSVMPDSATPWTAACQASLSFTNSQGLLKLMSIETVMPTNHLIFPSCLQSFPASGSFLMSWLFVSGGQSIGASASASVLPMNIQDWSPLGWTGWISLQSKGLSRVFSNTIAQKHQFFSAQISSQSNSHIHTWPLEKP